MWRLWGLMQPPSSVSVQQFSARCPAWSNTVISRWHMADCWDNFLKQFASGR